MADPLSSPEDHLPARSQTPTAWITLGLLCLVFVGWLGLDSLVCGALRVGASAAAWTNGFTLSAEGIQWMGSGHFRIKEVTITSRRREFPSRISSQGVECKVTSPWSILRGAKNAPTRLLQEVRISRATVLADCRGASPVDAGTAKGTSALHLPSPMFFPASFSCGTAAVVVIGESFRLEVQGLSASLPDRWPGKISYKKAILDEGGWHRALPGAAARAMWEDRSLRIEDLMLLKGLRIEEFTLTPRRDTVQFGWSGRVGNGRLRGDGSLGKTGQPRHLEATVVGENLPLGILSGLLLEDEKKATGTIHQARLTFRGEADRPMEADCSVRLVGDAFRWEGLGWESLRLGATLTGRTLTLTEFSLRQKENELWATGQSKLPEDWRSILHAPFTATFEANLQDAADLAALGGREFSQISGRLTALGEIHGADNKAEGYCNIEGSGLRIHELPIDWLKASLLFEGEKTRLCGLEAGSAEDLLWVEGTIQNSAPHSYAGKGRLKAANATRNLSRLGITPPAASFGSGGLEGSWEGSGTSTNHAGTFQVSLREWVCGWTKTGMTGRFEGAYAPGKLTLEKAELRQQDLRLGFRLDVSPTRLSMESVSASRSGGDAPLIEGDLSLPLNGPEFWRSGDLGATLAMGEPLKLNLAVHDIKIEEVADLLGQQSTCSGDLEGTIRASGTPERPDVHATLNLKRFSPCIAAKPVTMDFVLDGSDGRAALHAGIGSRERETLKLDAQMPFRWIRANDASLKMPENEPIGLQAEVREFLLEGWSRLAGLDLPLRSALLSGKLSAKGTWAKPGFSGSMLLTATECPLPSSFWRFCPPGMTALTALKLPLEFSADKVSLSSGSAEYAGTTVGLTGTWSAEGPARKWSLEAHGKDMPMIQPRGWKLLGDVDARLSGQGAGLMDLGGSATIRTAEAWPAVAITPSFSPPGIPEPPTTFEEIADPWKDMHLDLVVKTPGGGAMVKQKNGEHPQTGAGQTEFAMDLRLQGTPGTPIATGSVTVKNTEIQLPCGKFFVPEEKLTFDGGAIKEELTAVGATKRGFCIFRRKGPESPPWLQGAPGITAEDLVLALATPPQSAPKAAANQMVSWSRQKALFSMPAEGWATANLEPASPASLGFSGAAWLFDRDSAGFFSTPGRQALPKE